MLLVSKPRDLSILFNDYCHQASKTVRLGIIDASCDDSPRYQHRSTSRSVEVSEVELRRSCPDPFSHLPELLESFEYFLSSKNDD